MDFIKECLAQLRMMFRLRVAMAEKLEELETRIYALEEDNKLLKARNKLQDEKLYKLSLVVQSGEKPPAPASAVTVPKKTGY